MKTLWGLLLCGFTFWYGHQAMATAEVSAEELSRLKSLIEPGILSDENTIELNRLALDNPSRLTENLISLWNLHKDEGATLLRARIIWLLTTFSDEKLFNDEKIDILPLLDATIAFALENDRSVPVEELQYQRFRLEFTPDSKSQSEHIQNLIRLARRIRQPQSRAKILGALVHGMSARGEFNEQLPDYLNEIRHILGDRRDYNAGDVFALISLSQSLVSIGREAEAKVIDRSLADLCNRVVMRSFCAMQSYESGLELIKMDSPENAERSKAFFLRALEQATPINDLDYIGLSYYGLNIAHNKTKQFEAAVPYGVKALEIYKELESPIWQASTLKNLASSYLGQKSYGKALQAAEDALKVCPAEYSIDLMKIYDKLAEIHEAMGHEAKALKYFKLSAQKKDEANSKDADKKYIELRNEALSQQNALQQEQISLLSKFKLVSLIVAGLSLVLTFVLVLVWRQARTIRLSQQKMKNVLENIDEGIVVLDRSLKIERGYSPHVDTIFEKNPLSLEGSDLLNLLMSGTTENSGEVTLWRETLLMCIGEQSLSWELNASHLPREIIRSGKILSLMWQPLFNPEAVIFSYLISMRDVTDQRAMEQQATRESERVHQLHQILREILAGKITLIRPFIQETWKGWQKLKLGLQEKDQRVKALQQLHSWKGGARSLGLKKLAESLHEMESWIIAKSEDMETHPRLDQWLNAYSELLISLTADHSEEVAKDLYAFVGIYSLEMQNRLDPLGIPYRGVLVLDRVVRWDPEILNRIHDILLHALSNALDHGFARHREIMNSRPPALIQIEATQGLEGLVLQVIDNGRGIDWNRLRSKALEQGRSSSNQEELVGLLFEAGFSTAEELSETSGRGVGLSAIRSICKDMGGHTVLTDTPGGGTTLRLEFPTPPLQASL